MASAPLNWLLKIGGDALTTTAQTLSAAVNELKTAIAGLGTSKQDVLTFDNTPTENSDNPVTSDGIYDAFDSVNDALATKVNSADLAAVATSGSYNDLDDTPAPVDISGKMNIDGSNADSHVKFGGAFTVGSRDSSGTVGDNSFVVSSNGSNVTASGKNAVGIGSSYVIASGNGSFAQGKGLSVYEGGVHIIRETEAAGVYSYAQGYGVRAIGDASHAEGSFVKAAGNYSHCGGSGDLEKEIIAYRDVSFVHGNYQGKFRSTNMSEKKGQCFGFDMSGGEWTSDTTVTDSMNGCQGTISGGAVTITLTLETQGIYLLAANSYTISNGNITGATARMITAHGTSTGTPTNSTMVTTSTAPTISMEANNKITIKNASANVCTQFHLIRLA